MSGKVAVVTGANKGIGYAIVKGLCEKYSGDIYLTARDETRGKNAVAELKKLGFNPIYHQLDITNVDSITTFRDHIKEKYGSIDILVNNAAIAFKSDATEPFSVQAEQTTFVNYFSLVSVCQILFPLLKSGSKVVNLSSSLGHLSRIPGKELRKRFADPNLTVAQLSELMKSYVQSVKDGRNVTDGWGSSAYDVSKVAVTALTMIQNREYGPNGIYINSVHPGYVDTDMTSHKGPLTIEQGAKAPLILAFNEKQYKGVYMWYDGSIADWYSESITLD